MAVDLLLLVCLVLLLSVLLVVTLPRAVAVDARVPMRMSVCCRSWSRV